MRHALQMVISGIVEGKSDISFQVTTDSKRIPQQILLLEAVLADLKKKEDGKKVVKKDKPIEAVKKGGDVGSAGSKKGGVKKDGKKAPKEI